jgi:mono/diheme cytochrome c family protein
MHRYFAVPILLACLAAAAAAGNSDELKKAAEPPSELAQAPAAARARRNPYAGRPTAVQAGKLLYDRHCAQCHGADAKGRGKAPDVRSESIRTAPPGAVLWVLRNGDLKDGMPAWSSLPDQQLWQLVSFLQAKE